MSVYCLFIIVLRNKIVIYFVIWVFFIIESWFFPHIMHLLIIIFIFLAKVNQLHRFDVKLIIYILIIVVVFLMLLKISNIKMISFLLQFPLVLLQFVLLLLLTPNICITKWHTLILTIYELVHFVLVTFKHKIFWFAVPIS